MQLLHRHAGGGKQFDEQIGPLLAQAPGGGQHPQILPAGEPGLFLMSGLQLALHLKLPVAAEPHLAVGSRQAGVDGPAAVALRQKPFPPAQQGIRPDHLVLRQPLVQLGQAAAVVLHRLRRPAPLLKRLNVPVDGLRVTTKTVSRSAIFHLLSY